MPKKDDNKPKPGQERKSKGRSDKLHGGVKKQGAGKASWGVPGDEMSLPAVDPKDPIFDSEEEFEGEPRTPITREVREARLAAKLGCTVPLGTQSPAPGKPALDVAMYKLKCKEIVLEFFSSEDFIEAQRSLDELACPSFSHEFVRKLVELSMDKHERERELASRMISAAHGSLLTMSSVSRGFERLFQLAEELVLDVPNARQLLSQFLARALADEALPPSFCSDQYILEIAGDIVAEAKTLVSSKHGVERLEKIWGPAALAGVDDLKLQIKTLILEFFDTEDVDEAMRCVSELRAVHFHHEVVKRAVVLALERSSDALVQVRRFFNHLVELNLFTVYQVESGMRRVLQELPDLVLDIPTARETLKDLVKLLVSDELLDSTWLTVDLGDEKATEAVVEVE